MNVRQIASVPFSPVLEDLYIPSADSIARAVKKSMAH